MKTLQAHRCVGLLALGLGALAIAAHAAPPAAKPNVIIVITDDQGYGDLSCHGNPVLKTPHLDRLHAESIRLTDFHVAPMCTPTRGQLSPADWEDSFLDQGAQIRSGSRRNGAWNVVVDREGDYEIELRRWARETDAALAAGLPPHRHADGQFPAGAALPMASARLRIAGFDQSQAVAVSDKSAVFTAKLKAGRTQLQTWFYDADGQALCGAYYVYVTRK